MRENGGNGHHGDGVGAVLVVGGGIGGMQAALDLAEAGLYVYLLERAPAIGGTMAQLDKTFPTNDCAMCIMSPKLVDAGRHRNIEIITTAELLDLQGEPGNFTAHILKHPRYIDVTKCTGCGDCAKVCPVIVPDTFNEGLSKRRAANKLYPQAVPNAYTIEKRGIAPCRDACPAGQRAQGYIALIREGRYEDALRVIKMDNPFPGICGRICNHRCETACNRGLLDEPINIRALKRFVTDKVYAAPRQPVERAERKYDQRVAIIGAGPCGLTAAQDLARAGYGVTVFEAMPVAGGMLRLGVPEYRLPTDIIEREVQDIIDLGVDLRLNSRVDNLDDVFAEGFNAVLIAVGAHEGVRLPIPGADLQGVLINTRFLRDVRLKRYTKEGEPLGDAPPLGKRVLVLGGGNVAIDVARTVIRLGREVHMACLESRDAMPAHPQEIEAAEAEGVVIHAGRTFERILDDKSGHPAGVVCQHVASFQFDEMGRLHVEKAPNSEHTLPCDTVIFSVGQRAGLAFIPGDAGVGLTRRSLIAVNPNTLAATRQGVFAAGDSVSGTAYVIEAVDSGHVAARSIVRYLQGEHLEPPRKPDLPVVHLSREEIEARVARGEVRRHPRVPMPELPLAQRVGNFTEVERGYDDASAQAEAARCLACGVCSECMSCTFACGVAAIDHDMVERVEEVRVGAVILAPGYQTYRAELSGEYGYGHYPNVVTSPQFERLLSASGPTMGVVQRPSDGAHPRKVAWIQCVGSRDQTCNADYCSSVCCMYATKEAIIAKEHDAGIEPTIFYMDIRAFGKGFEHYIERAQREHGVRYVRSMPAAVRETPDTKNLRVQYATPDGKNVEEEFDMVVLSVGLRPGPETAALAARLGVDLNRFGFAEPGAFHPAETSRPGVYVAGAFAEPKDIPETVIEASCAGALASGLLAMARDTLTVTPEYPPERDVSEEEPRVGVFVCHCGINIGSVVNVPEVVEYARTLPHVAYAEHNLYTCSQDTQARIRDVIVENGLNRVIVASCTPRTHEPLFQDTLRAAGLNPHLFEMANIREQASWVHRADPAAATDKAKDLVRMAASKAAKLVPVRRSTFAVNNHALVIGGGIAGMTAALSVAAQGFPVTLVEREAALGGNLRHILTPLPSPLTLSRGPLSHKGRGDYQTTPIPPLPSRERGTGGEGENGDPQALLRRTTAAVSAEPRITVMLGAAVEQIGGYKGRFTTTVKRADGTREEIEHGAVIVATGAQMTEPRGFGYGALAGVVTQREFEAEIAACASTENIPRAVAMIQCVGSRDAKHPYCSRICCTEAIKNALHLKAIDPDAQVYILYRDIRTYGFRETLYTEARRRGVIFLEYDPDQPPVISPLTPIASPPQRGEGTFPWAEHPSPLAGEGGDQGSLGVRGLTVTLNVQPSGQPVTLRADRVVLSAGIEPDAVANDALAKLLKVPLNEDGFFLEAHVKLRPLDFAAEGVYLCGLAHSPRFIDEAMAQARGAAMRAASLLSKRELESQPLVAEVNPRLCAACGVCVEVCPYGARVLEDGVPYAQVIEVLCQGCGACVVACPNKASQQRGFTPAQVLGMADMALVQIE